MFCGRFTGDWSASFAVRTTGSGGPIFTFRGDDVVNTRLLQFAILSSTSFSISVSSGVSPPELTSSSAQTPCSLPPLLAVVCHANQLHHFWCVDLRHSDVHGIHDNTEFLPQRKVVRVRVDDLRLFERNERFVRLHRKRPGRVRRVRLNANIRHKSATYCN